MQFEVMDKTGKSTEKISVSQKVFGVVPNPSLIAHYVRVYNANQRQGTSKTKDRSEVRGGGRKPWRQKGTGRARHGSIRSPIWRKGGVVFGPQPKDWSLKMPKKMKRGAMVSALSAAASNNGIFVLENLNMKSPSSKQMLDILKKLNLEGKILLVLNSNDMVIRKSAGNLYNVSIAQAANLNPYQVLNAQKVLFLRDALEHINKKYEN